MSMMLVNPYVFGDPTEVLRMDFEGPNGSTTIIDSTGRHSPYVTGFAAISTSVHPYGTSSLRCPGGNTDRCFVPPSTDFYFPSGQDFRIRFTFVPDSIGVARYPFGIFNSTGSTVLQSVSVNTGGTLTFTGFNPGNFVLGSGTIVALTPYDVEINRIGSTMNFLLNNVVVGTVTSNSTIGNSGGALYTFGGLYNSGSGNIACYIDRVIVNKH